MGRGIENVRDCLGALAPGERYVMSLHVPCGVSFETALRRLHDVASVAWQQFGDLIEVDDAQLSRENVYGPAVRIYANPVRSASEAIAALDEEPSA